jgi:hypothetical protein
MQITNKLMEVILKKTKITNAILKQALRSTVADLEKGEILGWCLFDKSKFIVCYRSDINGLSIYRMFQDITGTYSELKVNYSSRFISLTYKCENEEDRNKLTETLERAKTQAQARGQFFI